MSEETNALAPVAAMGEIAARPANATLPCRTWTDPELRVKFPEKLGGLRMSSRCLYDSMDDVYSLVYGQEGAPDGKGAVVFVYTRGRRPVADGAEKAVEGEVVGLADYYKNHPAAVSASGIIGEYSLARSGLKCQWTSAVCEFDGHSGLRHAVALVTTWRRRFVKLIYSEPVALGPAVSCEKLPDGARRLLDDLDSLVAGAVAADKRDVYAIADPAEALAALRQKRLGADMRVSMADMPDYEEKFFELNEAQDWCLEDIAKRANVFENVSREGVRLRIEPQIWHYNLACALARQGKTEEAFASLEQAVASGYNKAAHMENDSNFESLRNDARFAKLAAMARTITAAWNAPGEKAKTKNGRLPLDELNVYYAFNDWSYLVNVETDVKNPIVYLDHNSKHNPPPVEDVLCVEFSESLREAGRDVGAANIHFFDAQSGAPLPTALLCDATFCYRNPFAHPNCIPADFPLYRENYRKGAQRELRHFAYWNVLGIYAASGDYGADGIDRFIGNFPGCIAYEGDKGDGFVRLYKDIVSVLPSTNRMFASQIALNVIRHAQKCATNETAYMDGAAHRPALSFADIDCERALADAKSLTDRPLLMPLVQEFSFGFVPMRANDIFDGVCSRIYHSKSACHACLVASWGNKTATFEVEMLPLKDLEENAVVDPGCRYEWRTLQGGEKKVRIAATNADASKARIEIDYHEVFDVPLANGKTVKSSRVDVGCFLVNRRGRASVPAIFSVYFNPNETREYSADGKLLSIDYTKRQIDDWRPSVCAKGNWKDVFRYTADGKPAGWTRFTPGDDGSVATNEFTRDGLVVVTRDSLGRPKDARRDMKMEWSQNFEGRSFGGSEYDDCIAYNEFKFDQDAGHPDSTALLWRYDYENDKDVFGKASPKPFKPFAYRPEANKLASFTEESGFRLPLVDQMRAGLRHSSSIRGTAAGANVLKKMEFCPWKPSTNDAWKVDADDFEAEVRTNLVELADGAYRIRIRADGTTNESFVSVNSTLWGVNGRCEERAYEKLDKEYFRVPRFVPDDISAVVVDGAPLRSENLPKGVKTSIALWELPGKIRFSILCLHDTPASQRWYSFTNDSRRNDIAGNVIGFEELPSRAIGNTVLRAFAGEAEAMNNLAVLLYAKIANPNGYNELQVRTLLERAARKGCETARRNLETLEWNWRQND